MNRFSLFGPAHLAILASVPLAAALLAWMARRSDAAARRTRLATGAFVLANTLLWYGYSVAQGWTQFPYGLPLHLCDITCLLALISVFTLKRWSFDQAYYWSMAGTSMAMLTPDLWDEFPSYPSIQFFVAHGGILVVVLFLVWSGQRRPRPGSLWRALIGVNLFAAAVGAFNYVFDTNYMYLCEKPPNASLLDWFGPWPWYVLAGEVTAIVLFTLLWLPFRQAGVRQVSAQTE